MIMPGEMCYYLCVLLRPFFFIYFRNAKMFIYLNKNANEALCRFYFHKKIKLFLTQINVSFLANGTSGKFCIN